MEGLPMGSSLSPFMAELFMDNMEKTIHKTKYKTSIGLWLRYVDDVLVIWKSSLVELEDFLQYLNSIHDNLKFTLEVEQKGMINYLDMSLHNTGNSINIGVYHKPCNKNIIIPYISSHSNKHKLAAFQNYFYRLFKFPLTKKSFEQEVDFINIIASRYGLPNHLIKSIFNKMKHERGLAYSSSQIDSSKTDFKFFSIKYFDDPYLLNKIARVYNKHKICLNFRNLTLKKHLQTSLNSIELLQQSGVYKLCCKNCNAVYIGETGRQIGTRINEHKKDYIKSNMGRHLHLHGHELDISNIKLLHKTKKGSLQLCWESAEIHKCMKDQNIICLNDKTHTFSNTLYMLEL